ncbi:MAG: DHH family phosphoesterase, partial [Candidatus Aenigmarchaeota archaeon]|nr:DHH family phosphoesterase [Candidatus Aenigmarchaeota archaeon]
SIEYVPKSKNIIFMNPRSKNQKLYIPTSCILFHVIPKGCLDEKTIFMCALGTLSDIGLNDCRDLYVKFSEIFPGYFGVNNIEKYEKTKLFKYVELLSSALLLNRSSSGLNKLLRKIKDPAGDIISREFEKYKKIVDREVEREIERFRKERIQLDKNVFFYLMKTRLPVKTVIAYKLAKKYRSKIILIGQKISGSKILISARRGSLVKENLIDVLSRFSDELGLITYGGHPKAAGAIADSRQMKLKL